MKFSPLAVVLALAINLPVLAQPKADDHAAHHAPTASAAADTTEGEIRKVDKDAARLTIKHGEIRNLGMPPMTMVFVVKDKALLDKVKAGDKIRFTASDEGGKLTVVGLSVQP